MRHSRIRETNVFYAPLNCFQVTATCFHSELDKSPFPKKHALLQCNVEGHAETRGSVQLCFPPFTFYTLQRFKNTE